MKSHLLISSLCLFTIALLFSACSTSRTAFESSLSAARPTEPFAGLASPSSLEEPESPPVFTQTTTDASEPAAPSFSSHPQPKKTTIEKSRTKTLPAAVALAGKQRRQKAAEELMEKYRRSLVVPQPEPPSHTQFNITKGLAILCSFFIPPLGTGLYFGVTTEFWISLILFLFFWLPGFIYALIVILND